MTSDFENASDADWETASRRESVIAPLASKTDRSDADIQHASKALQLSRATVFRLIRRYQRNPRTSTLLPEQRGRKEGTQLLSEEEEHVIARELENFYLTPQRPSLAALHRRIVLICRQAGLRVPSYNAIRARVDTIDLKERIRLRHGNKAASDRFQLIGNGPAPGLPLDLVQIDHTLADVIIVNEVNRQPIGRPWITMAIDVATRAVPGFYIDLEHPSTRSVAQLISRLVLPKEGYLRERKIDEEWPMYGLPRRIHVDNGKEFHAHALVRGCKEYGIDLQHRPPRRPTYGAHIERLIGTMMGETHLLPGATFSSVKDRADYDSAKHAVMTLKEFELWFAYQVVGVYHHQLHSGIGMPPLHAWKIGVEKNPGVIRAVLDPKRFYLDFLPYQLRKVRRDGIRLFNIHYRDVALEALTGRSEQKYIVKYDPANLCCVYLKVAPGEYVKIPYRDLSRPPITLSEHKWATRELRKQGRLAVHEDNLFAAIAAQRRLIEQATHETQSARRTAEKNRLAMKAREGAKEKQGTKSSSRLVTEVEPIRPVKPYPFEVWDDN